MRESTMEEKFKYVPVISQGRGPNLLCQYMSNCDKFYEAIMVLHRR